MRVGLSVSVTSEPCANDSGTLIYIQLRASGSGMGGEKERRGGGGGMALVGVVAADASTGFDRIDVTSVRLTRRPKVPPALPLFTHTGTGFRVHAPHGAGERYRPSDRRLRKGGTGSQCFLLEHLGRLTGAETEGLHQVLISVLGGRLAPVMAIMPLDRTLVDG